MLTGSDKERIKAAVARAEESTAGELVVVLTKSSSDYALPRSIASVALTIVVAWEALNRLSFDLHPVIAMAQLPVFFLLYFAFGTGGLLRLIVRRPLREQAVMERAARAFVEEGVTETRDRSGVLIFLSELEHQVVILADKGINDRVEPTEWETDVASIVSAIGARRAADGVVSAVERIGGLLAEAFPPRSDDANELSDAVREVD